MDSSRKASPGDAETHDRVTGDDLRRARSQHGLPAGGDCWFWKQNSMLRSAPRGTEFTVAWTKTNGRFMYGFYDCPRAFFERLLKCPADKRHAYELIRSDRPCVAYADIEWEGEKDTEHEIVRKIVSVVRGICKDKLGIEAEVCVSCSTRRKTGSWKNSYHVVVRNLVLRPTTAAA